VQRREYTSLGCAGCGKKKLVGWNCCGNQQIVKFVAIRILEDSSLRLPRWSMLEPWREVVQPEGLMRREGGTLPGVV
jgi:hypothetical protein